jgi:hypothetical protein
MNAPVCVQLSITEGSVIIPSLHGAGVAATHYLWDGAVASEYFPQGAGDAGANYVVTLKKEATQASEVRHVENELMEALFMLAMAWSFAGGSHMDIESRELTCSPRFESNANVVEQELLERDGLRKVAPKFSFPLEIGATYAKPPMTLAIRIAELMRADLPAKRLLHYYYHSRMDRIHGTGVDAVAWCLTLYKVRDFLCKLYKKKKEKCKISVERNLGGVPGWDTFGCLLNNNDLRHAEVSGIAPPLSQQDIDWLYATAYAWISSYLRTKGFEGQ